MQGSGSKKFCHLMDNIRAGTALHRAFSVFVFNSAGVSLAPLVRRQHLVGVVMRRSSEEGSYVRLVDFFVSLDSRPRVIKKKKKKKKKEGVGGCNVLDRLNRGRMRVGMSHILVAGSCHPRFCARQL